MAAETSALTGLSATPATFVGPSSMFPIQTKFTKLTYFFFPHDPLDRWRGRKTYKYVLTVVDVASFKVAEPVTSKEAKEIAGAFRRNREFKIEERGRRHMTGLGYKKNSDQEVF